MALLVLDLSNADSWPALSTLPRGEQTVFERPILVKGGARIVWNETLSLDGTNTEDGSFARAKRWLAAMATTAAETEGVTAAPAPALASELTCCILEQESAPEIGLRKNSFGDDYEHQKNHRFGLDAVLDGPLVVKADSGPSPGTKGQRLRYMCELYVRHLFPNGSRPALPWFEPRENDCHLDDMDESGLPNFFVPHRGVAGRLEAVYCGPRGSHSNLHTDEPLGIAVIHSLSGCKRLHLWPPYAGPGLSASLDCYEHTAHQLSVSFPMDNSDSEVRALIEQHGGCTAFIEAGDTLLLPPYWWHQASNMSQCVLSVHDMVLLSPSLPLWLDNLELVDFAVIDVLTEILPAKLARLRSGHRHLLSSPSASEDLRQIFELAQWWKRRYQRRLGYENNDADNADLQALIPCLVELCEEANVLWQASILPTAVSSSPS